jgi:hypothetical protein
LSAEEAHVGHEVPPDVVSALPDFEAAQPSNPEEANPEEGISDEGAIL